MQLPVTRRDALVKLLSEAYKKQKDEMDEANRKNGKGKGKNRSTKYY